MKSENQAINTSNPFKKKNTPHLNFVVGLNGSIYKKEDTLREKYKEFFEKYNPKTNFGDICLHHKEYLKEIPYEDRKWIRFSRQLKIWRIMTCASFSDDRLQFRTVPVSKNGFISCGTQPEYQGRSLVFLDYDVPKNEEVTFNLEALDKALGEYADTFTQATPTGGFHKGYYLKEPYFERDGKKIDITPANTQEKSLEDHTELTQKLGLQAVDIRGKGGKIFASGTKFVEHGLKEYKIVNANLPMEITLQEFSEITGLFLPKELYDPFENLNKAQNRKRVSKLKKKTSSPNSINSDSSEIPMKIREGFKDILEGTVAIEDLKLEKFKIFSALFRECLNCEMIQEEIISFLELNQGSFKRSETENNLNSQEKSDNWEKRPTKEHYSEIFSEYLIKKAQTQISKILETLEPENFTDSQILELIHLADTTADRIKLKKKLKEKIELTSKEFDKYVSLFTKKQNELNDRAKEVYYKSKEELTVKFDKGDDRNKFDQAFKLEKCSLKGIHREKVGKEFESFSFIEIVDGCKKFQEITARLRNQTQNSNRISVDTRNNIFAHAFKDVLLENGRFIYDIENTPYFFRNKEKDVLEIGVKKEHAEFLAYISKWGINHKNREGNVIIQELVNYCLKMGEKVQTYQQSHYDKLRKQLYIFDGVNQIFRLDGNQIVKIDNGEDGVFFRSAFRNNPIELVDEIDEKRIFYGKLRDGKYLFQRMTSCRINFSETELSIEQKAFLYDVYFIGIMFRELFSERAGALFIGDTGSGKTLAHSYFSLFYTNEEPFSLTKDQRDFRTTLNHFELANFENVDTNYNNEFDDIIASTITGSGNTPLRELHTTKKSSILKPKTWIIFDARTPRFLRADNLNRFVMFKLDSFQNSIGEFEVIQRDVFKKVFEEPAILNEIWSELFVVFNQIIRKLQSTNNSEIKKYPLRIAEFARFMEICGDIFEKDEKFVKNTMRALAKEQQEIGNQGTPLDTIFQNLKGEWEKHCNGKSFIIPEPKNLEKKMYFSATILHELCQKHFPSDYHYKSAQAFGRALNERKAYLYKEYGFRVFKTKKKTLYYFEDREIYTGIVQNIIEKLKAKSKFTISAKEIAKEIRVNSIKQSEILNYLKILSQAQIKQFKITNMKENGQFLIVRA
ncbi:hypothetical protein NEF87_000202 [Candidatus Lokiarchaeum ossiferum]|uniref:DNA primase/polymerase bifunctional N-terminal domain-containing protein n=1 Tax=Candidatus Lokiarchaeum ossiferum TaxID=2951803 RepID=A0ABY6HM01_9ARCH|nr:hypothetical protein NEF87_000202 [Candidatus Lokiarchaeum sp. B-35]